MVGNPVAVVAARSRAEKGRSASEAPGPPAANAPNLPMCGLLPEIGSLVLSVSPLLSLEINVSAAVEDSRTRVFLSYSRKDLDFVIWLSSALGRHGCSTDFDRSTDNPSNIATGISAEDAWWTRLEEMITSAEVMIFVVSPDSIQSKVCSEEIAFAQTIGKRIIPVLMQIGRFRKGSAPSIRTQREDNIRQRGCAPDC
jgi:hypothetical protein